METIWFYLEPYTFISEDKGCYMLYNSRDQKGISILKSESINILVRKLQNTENMYSVKLSKIDFEDENLYNFVQTVQKSGYGNMIDGKLEKPIIMPPILNLQRSIERLREQDISLSNNILSYLHEVAIYVNGDCPLNCKNCSNEFKQHYCCTKSKNLIDFDLLRDFLYSILYSKVSVTILGGNIFQYANLKEVLVILEKGNAVHTIVSHWKNIPIESEILAHLSNSHFKLKILISDPYNIASILSLARILKLKNINPYWEISITSLSEYEGAVNLVEQLNCLVDNVAIIPIYNGKNIRFFEEYIFMEEEEISTIQLNRRNIFALQVLNTNSFGKIFVSSNGKVYANMNEEAIGYIADPIKEILCKEFERGTSWRRTRYNIEPCAHCRFKIICPSPSNYEIVIGRSNLCHIKD